MSLPSSGGEPVRLTHHPPPFPKTRSCRPCPRPTASAAVRLSSAKADASAFKPGFSSSGGSRLAAGPRSCSVPLRRVRHRRARRQAVRSTFRCPPDSSTGTAIRGCWAARLVAVRSLASPWRPHITNTPPTTLSRCGHCNTIYFVSDRGANASQQFWAGICRLSRVRQITQCRLFDINVSSRSAPTRSSSKAGAVGKSLEIPRVGETRRGRTFGSSPTNRIACAAAYVRLTPRR